jgi:hypothetical protein
MKNSLSRRDVLKLAGLGFGAMAFRPKPRDLEQFYLPKQLPQFPNSPVIGRVVDRLALRNQALYDPTVNNAIQELGADTLVEWGRVVVGSAAGLSNQTFVETPQGFIYASSLQPTRNLPNVPLQQIPAGKAGFWAEVTVPYIDLTLDGVAASPWMQDHILFNFPPRLYYGQTVWIDQIRNINGFIEYRWNEGANGHGYGYGAYGEFFWCDGAGLKPLTDDDVSLISPNVDPKDKIIVVNLDNQSLSCYEANREVFYCRISSGIKIDLATGQASDKLATPTGDLNTHWKIISKNMTAGDAQAGYSTPAVPWCTFVSGDGVAIHGAFWHNAFGEKRSHGCINVLPEHAKWIFRWTTPFISLDQGEQRMTWPDHGTVVSVSEKTLYS